MVRPVVTRSQGTNVQGRQAGPGGTEITAPSRLQGPLGRSCLGCALPPGLWGRGSRGPAWPSLSFLFLPKPWPCPGLALYTAILLYL